MTYAVSVALRAKVDQYVGGMNKANVATESLRKKSEQVRKEQVLLSKAAGIVGTAVVAAFVGKAIGAASDLNETLSKTSVVFGDNAAAVKAWSATSATALGMSQNAAAGAAATYGNLFVSLGLAQKPAAEMSMKLVTLAGDLASFNNVDPAEALDALRSGLTGETEPLRRFGVNINDATLRQQALKMGLISTTKDALDPAVKAQASYALILAQTGTAQGDFARTSDGLANQMRILNAQWVDAQAGIGQALLPAAQAAVGVLNTLTGIFNTLPGPVKATVLGIVLLGAAFLALAPQILAAKQLLGGFALGAKGASGAAGIGSFRGALGKVGSFVGSAGPWGLAIGAGIAALGLFGDSSEDAARAQDSFRSALDASNGALDEQVRKTVAAEAESRGLLRAAQRLGVSERVVVDAILGDADARQRLADATDAAVKSSGTMAVGGRAVVGSNDEQRASAVKLAADVSTLNGLFSEQADATDRTAAAAGNAVAPTGDLTDALAFQVDAIALVVSGWDKLDGILGRQDRRDAAIKSIQDLGKALAENGPVIRGDSEAALANRDAYRKAVGAVEDHLKSIGRGPAAIKAYDDEVGKLRATLVKSKLSPAEINALLKPITDMRDGLQGLASMKPIPIKLQPRILGNGQIFIGSQGGKAVGEGYTVGYRAAGGPVRKGMPYVVGERRAEMFVPTQSGRIEPSIAPTLARAQSSGGSMLVVGNGIPIVLQAEGEQLAQVLLTVKRRGGGVELGLA